MTTKKELIDMLALLPATIAEQEKSLIEAYVAAQTCKKELTEAEDDLFLRGVIDGKNAEIRAAQLRANTADKRADLQKAENKISVERAILDGLNNQLAAYIAIAGMLKGAE